MARLHVPLLQVQLSIPTEEPIKAVVTVPASFNQFQRQATKDAADIAGLELLQLMPKPTAVAVQYAADQFSMATGASSIQRFPLCYAGFFVARGSGGYFSLAMLCAPCDAIYL